MPLEKVPSVANEKYKITKVKKNTIFNHQGLVLNNSFYYYSPFFNVERDAKNPSILIEKLSNLSELGNNIWIRVDETLMIEEQFYTRQNREFCQIYHGKEIDLDKIEFPLNKREEETLCVYNPETMKKIQFKISHRKDSEKWIEIEELYPIKEEEKPEWYLTRYLHSIFDEENNRFVHIDGSFNFYNEERYKIRSNKSISASGNARANYHEKFWLTEGEISILDWGKLLLYFFDDPDLIFDALEGKLVSEIFDAIL